MPFSCLVCGSEDTGEYSSGLVPIHHCKSCNLYFPYGDSEEIIKKCEEFYKEEYYKDRVDKNYKQKTMKFLLSLPIFKEKTAESQYNFVKKYLGSKKTLLEIGAGTGRAVNFWLKKGFEVMAVEPGAKACEEINRRFGRKIAICGIFEKTEIVGKFDVIYSSHVLEHSVRPDIFLTKAKKNLNTNSIIFVEVPNCENKEILDDSISNPSHLYHFTRDNLSRLFTSAGYDVLKTGTYKRNKSGIINRVYENLFSSQDAFIETTKDDGSVIRIIAKSR